MLSACQCDSGATKLPSKTPPRDPLAIPEGLARLASSPEQRDAFKRDALPVGLQEALARLAPLPDTKRVALSLKRQTAEPPEPAQWRSRPPKAAVGAAMLAIAAAYRPGARPRFEEIYEALKASLGPGVTRQQARDAIAKYAPRLRGLRGYRSKT